MSFKKFLHFDGKISKEDQEFYILKNKAAEYYRANGIPQKIEEVLNEMFYEKPDDIYGYLANYFSGFSRPPVIRAITGREVCDARGEPALRADVYCVIRNEEKLVCSAVITGVDDDVEESEDVVANGNHQQVSVAMALEWIREHLSSMLHGFNPTHQTHLDKLLSDFLLARYLEDQDARRGEEKNVEEKRETENDVTPPPAPTKDKKGREKGKKGNGGEKPVPPPEPSVPVLPGAIAVAAISLAAAKSAASLTGVPLYKHITTLRDPQALSAVPLPKPLLTVLSCGKTSAGKLNLLEEMILLPTAPYTARQIIGMGLELQREIKRMTMTAASKTGPVVLGVSEGGALQLSFDRAEQALDLVMEACLNLGLSIGSDLRLAINCAAHTLMDYPRGKYEVMAGCLKSPDELVDMLVGLVRKYPAIAALIDPFRKEDVEQWMKLSSLIGQSCCLIADMAYCYLPRWRDAKPLPPGVTWLTLRHRSEMTLTDLLHAVTEQREGETILAASGDEIGDDSLVDVAVGLGVSFLKLGGMSGGWRMNKYNRLLCIQMEMEEQDILAEMREVKLTGSK
ncbi:enolase 4 [Electrophorus electricus]|uniref:enolase 4 n=1 Tax=Electrophorus electricus TaxID=8005 RepID=UPI0015D06F19|nr:enolase 4 [Electrophorus electricus]